MAASVAPATEASSTSSLCAAEKIRSKGNISNKSNNSNTSSSASKNNSIANHTQTKAATSNSHELCRSCGKTSEDLYDLYHPTSPTAVTTTAAASQQLSLTDEATMPSPLTTSSTTCYGKSSATATLTANSAISSVTTNSTTSSTAACLSTATSCSSSNNAAAATFDSVAATAKATAKGQSNMENILQEMQIWHLQIKCNDGLPQRICAKCTAQFYMIHKFRRKCLKVQAQLRGLYEEQQKISPQTLNEEQTLPPPQQQKEVPKKIADSAEVDTANLEKEEAQINWPPSSTNTSKVEQLKVPTTSDRVDHDNPVILLPSSNNDLINDNSIQQQNAATVTSTVAATSEVSLSFDTTEPEKNANDAKTPRRMSPTLPDDSKLETMDVDTGATTTTRTEPQSSPLFENQTTVPQSDITTSDVVAAPLKEQQIKDTTSNSKQKCDNEMIKMPEAKRKRRNSKDKQHHHRRSKSTDKCLDNMDDHDVVIAEDNQQTASKLAEDALCAASELRHNPTEKRKKGRPRKSEMVQRSKSSPECSLLTKAALKSYSTVTTRATASAYDKASSLIRQQQLLKPSEEQRDQQQSQSDTKPSSQTTAATGSLEQQQKPLVSMTSCAGGLAAATATGKMRNDNNNNDHRRLNEADKKAKSVHQLNNFTENSKHLCSPSAKHHKSKKIHKAEIKEELFSAKRRTKQMQLQTQDLPREEDREDLEEPPRQRRKCSTSQYNKRDHHHRQHRHKLSEKSTMKRALCSSADSPELKTNTKKRRGRRRNQEAEDVRTSSTLEQQHGQISRHKSKTQEHTTFEDENEIVLTSHKALRDTENTRKASAARETVTASIFTVKGSLKGNPKALSPMVVLPSLSSSFYPAKQATATPATKNPVNVLAYNANDVKWQRRRSQRLSTSSSSSSLSSSSSSLLSSSDGDDDDDDDDDNDDVYYETNAYCRLQGIRNSLNSSINQQHVNTTIPSMYLWKTKAQMKANANDMNMPNIFKSMTTDTRPLEHIKPIIPENQTSSATEEANSSTCTITEGLRSQTLDDEEYEQPANSNPVETPELNTPHCPSDNDDDDQQAADDDHDGDGDDEDEDANNDRKPDKVRPNSSERPEEAVQKQIKRKQQSNDRNTDDDDSEAQCSEAEISCNSKEFNNKTDDDDSKQKPTISIASTTMLTPSSNKPTKSSVGGCSESAGGSDNRSRGGMKLILQRRSSTRFACLRKEDIWEEEVVTSPPSSASTSPVPKRKRKQSNEEKEEVDEEMVTFTTTAKSILQDTKTFCEEKETVRQANENCDVKQETKKYKQDQPCNYLEMATKPATSQTKEDETIQQTNNRNQTPKAEDPVICPGPQLEDHKTDDLDVSEVVRNAANDAEIPQSTNDDVKNKSSASTLEKDKSAIESQTEDNHKLVVRVPLASLTQHFKRLHLTKDTEEDKGLGKENQEDLGGKPESNETPTETNEEIDKTIMNPANEMENLNNKVVSEEASEKMDHNEKLTPSVSKQDMDKTETSSITSTEAPHDKLVKSEELKTAPLENSGSSEDSKPASTDNCGDDAKHTENDAIDQSKTPNSPHPVVEEKIETTVLTTLDSDGISSNEANQIENQCILVEHKILTPSHMISQTSPQIAASLEVSTLDPEILEFVQETESRGTDEITSSQGYCGASSKITDFINDFQNNCINSPEAEGDVNTLEVLPALTTAANPHLSDEIRDVEDTLNGILSEMHDRDMYTPRSGETEDFLAHSSIYSPMTDAPTTPSQSLYAESPCTVNSNPMSLSPFIQSHMDYNAMTPQSNHSSSMSGHTTATMSSTSSHPSGGSASSDHFPSYTDCFAEESTQSELIGFQNDIPCFENIDLPPTGDAAEDLLAIPNEGEEALTPSKQISNKDLLESLDKAADIKKDMVEIATDNLETPIVELKESPLVELPVVENPPAPVVVEMAETNVQYNTEEVNPTITQVEPSPSDAVAAPQQFVLTNTPHGPIFISTPPENSQQPQQQNVQYVTLDSNNSVSKMGWSNPPTPAAAATYFVNASGEIYLSNSNFNALLVPPQQSTPPMDTNDNYLQVYQGQPQQQPQAQHNNNNGSQYIMLVNNLTTPGGQQYITNSNGLGNSTVLLHTQVPNNNCSYISSQQPAGEMDLNATSNGVTMPTFSIATNIPGQHATVSLAPVTEEQPLPPPPPVPQEEPSHQGVQKLLQRKIQQQKTTQVPIQPRAPNQRTQKINLICRFCHKRPKFTNNVDYSNHIITMHPAEKPYNCDYCPKHFQRRTERQDHVAQVHGSRYQCAQCGVSFCAQRALDFHLQKYHASTLTCSIPPRIATVAPTQQSLPSSASASASSTPSSVNHLQQNSTSSTSSSSSAASATTSSPTTYHLLHNANAQQQRLVHVEDVQHTHNNAKDAEEETKNNKCSFDSQLDIMGETTATHQQQPQQTQQRQQQHYQQPTRKLCCPDCDGDDESCCSMKNTPQNNHKQLFNQQQQYTIGHQTPPHITIPSPEQTEPDSTTTLRHFRKNSMKSPTIVSMTSSSSNSSSCITYSACTYSNSNNNNKTSRYESSSSRGGEYYGTHKYISRDMHKCHLCDDAFPTANGLRRHRNITHNQHGTVMPFACTICKRGFRLRNALQRHMETHDAEGRPYECNICQVRFPRPSQLTLHKLTVHKFERVHTCDECGKQFGTESSLKAHEKVAHEANSMPLPFACVYLEAPKHQKPRVSKD